MVSNRIVLLTVAFTVIATFYSLSELHSLTAQHAAEDKQFVTASDQSSISKRDLSVTVAKKATVVAAKKASAKPGKFRPSFTYPNTELWGDVVEWGTKNEQPTAEACAQSCRDHDSQKTQDMDCNVWVWCGDVGKCKEQLNQCWLKHLVHPEASKPAKQGLEIFWTSGTLDVDMNADPSKGAASTAVSTDVPGTRKFHIVVSAQGSAVHWQVRVHYYWYNKQKAKCQADGGCDMGGWTRLLHSGQADDLMEELPTMVVDPLPSDMVEHSWYVVLNRPYAFVQWCEKANIPERYVLMGEPDHIYLRPIPNFMKGNTPAAFPFFYIEPSKPEHVKITQRFAGPITKKQMEEIAPIGNSPTFLTMDDMKRIMPQWMNTSIAVFKDTEASSVWGWVQEMYGFTIAAWIKGIKHVDLYLHMMAQPPWDSSLQMSAGKPFYILHYTYGMDYKLTGEFTPGKFGEWRFDKRTYSNRAPMRHMGNPPPGMKNDLVRALINSINEATAAIPCWEKYAETGRIDSTCKEDCTASIAAAAKNIAENVHS